MRRLLTIVALIAVIGIGGYLFLFQRDFVTGLFQKGAREVKDLTGAGPAKTPEEALDKFKEFAKKRDYETASVYLGGLYGEQMKKGAKSAEDLGTAVDSVRSLAEKRGITLTDMARAALGLLETFPTDIGVIDVKKEGDDKARARLILNATPQTAELKREGEGWKIYFAVPNEAGLRSSVDRLNVKAKDYIRSLEKIRDQINSKQIQTKDELAAKLLSELADAFK